MKLSPAQKSVEVMERIKEITLTSHGWVSSATTSLTGSCHLVTVLYETWRIVRVLIDCGLFQGKGSEKNIKLAIKPSEIDAVVVTHGHLDHCGRIPLLGNTSDILRPEVKIYMTPVTSEVVIAALTDTAHIEAMISETNTRQFVKWVKGAQRDQRIVMSRKWNGVARNKRGERMKGTGFNENIGEGENGTRIKNKIHGGNSIHANWDISVGNANERLKALGITPDTKVLEVQKAVGMVSPLSRPPLFTKKDILRIEQHFQPLNYDTELEILPGIQLSLSNAGHVPGSSMAFLKFQTGKKAEFYSTLFSGDLGRNRGDFFPYGKPEIPMNDPIDTVVHEATYGDRTHRERSEARDELTQILIEAMRDKKKALIIPCFALERAQALLHLLVEIRDTHGLDFILGLDSPLASHYTEIASECTEDESFRESLSGKKFRDDIERDGLHKWTKLRVIVTSSGMATGGPILDYLKRYGSDERFEFLFTGYQSEGTLGRDLTDGRQRQVSVEGVSREVRARIRMIKGLSAHADEEDLFSIFQYAERREKFWARQSQSKVVLIHGDHQAATLSYKLKLGRRKGRGGKGIPKEENIIIQEIDTPISLYINPIFSEKPKVKGVRDTPFTKAPILPTKIYQPSARPRLRGK